MATSNSEPVQVRIVEWEEWIPGEICVVGEMEHPQTGQQIKKQVALHRGLSGFKTDPDEKLIDLSVNGSGESKTLVVEKDGEELTTVYGLYLFQAVLVRNNTEYEDYVDQQDIDRKLMEEEAETYAKEKGRDKRSDLIIANGPLPPPPPPNRKARRKK